MSIWSENKPTSAKRTDTLNPIRNIIEKEFDIPKDPPIPLLNLALGEPTKKNGFPLPEGMNDVLIEKVNAETFNGYTPSNGCLEARQAIAEKFGHPDNEVDPENVFLTFGASGALFTVF